MYKLQNRLMKAPHESRRGASSQCRSCGGLGVSLKRFLTGLKLRRIFSNKAGPVQTTAYLNIEWYLKGGHAAVIGGPAREDSCTGHMAVSGQHRELREILREASETSIK